MAPRLEEEVVNQVMNETQDKQYLLDRIEALRELGFKVNDRKVETALKRYELLQEYNSQNNSRRARRKKIKEKFKKICEEEIEKLKENPSIISVKIKKFTRGNCDSCERNSRKTFSLKYIYLNKEQNILSKIKTEKSVAFDYCFKCGYFEERD